MAGFEDLGSFFAGNHAGNELSYQKGMALGANTENAMAQARERVRQNLAIERLQSDKSLAAQFGLGDMTDATITAMAAGLNPTQIMDTRLKGQEAGFRDIAGSQDPNVDAGARNRALAGVATGPVETFKAVGSKGYQNIFNPDQGVMPLGPEFNVGAGGGDAAAIQILRAFGMLDASDHVRPGFEKQAFDVMRTTGKPVDEGGVPGVIDFNPFAVSPRGAPPAAVSPGVGAELAPPLSAMPMPAAPPTAAAPRPAAAPPMASPVAGTGAVTPVSSAARVAANTAEIEKAKVVGKGAGESAVAAPGDLAEIDKLERTVNDFARMPGFDSAYGNVQGQPVVKNVVGLLDQDAQDAQAALQNLDAQTFGISIDNMRGMGALSNAEGQRVTDAFSTLSNTKQSSEAARKAIQLIQADLNLARTRIKNKQLLPVQKAGVSPYADPGKEARYQAWKASQGVK